MTLAIAGGLLIMSSSPTSTTTRRRAGRLAALLLSVTSTAFLQARPGAQAAPPAEAPPAGRTAAPQPQPQVTALTDTGWPRNIAAGQTTITLYQPQVDKWDGATLAGRAAVSVTETGSKTPIFGIVQFSTQTMVNKDTRLVTLEKFTITHATFPHAADAAAASKAQTWTSAIEARAARLQPIALDRLEAAVAVTAAERQGEAVAVKNDPPVIHVSHTPALLVPIDGEPVFRDVAGTSLARVVNARPLLLRDKGGVIHLRVFDGWMQAPGLGGPWTVSASPPKDCDTALKAAIESKSADLLVGGNPDDPASKPSLAKGAPQIFVETRPAEVIVTEGAPKFVPIENTSLVYAENTTGHIFVNASDQRAYVLVSGRWFAGPSTLAGPWSFVAGDQLPKDFARIPDDSPKENVKASVPGTQQAQEAVVANAVPQTAKVKRSDARFAPQIDGAPKLEPIEGTELRYVANASLPIVVVGKNTEYFGVQNGVWFVSNAVTGPWLVATTVPAVIYSIPPSSPLHYVTYVRVYDATPDYVVVGYTPGYYGAYVSGGCVVYGTGYVYTPWIGTYWYGPPVTYGFGVSLAYTPWTGWAVGFGFGWAWGASTVAVGWGWGPYPWWGPAGWGWGAYYPWVYSPVYGAAWGPRGGGAVWGPGYGAWATGNVYSHWGSRTAVTRSYGGYDAWTGNRWAGQSGMAYNSRTGNLSAGQRAAVGNVYTGRYAAGARGTTVNTRTGASVTGGKVTAGNAYTGREVTAGRAAIEGPHGGEQTIAGIRGNDGGIVKTGNNNVYAGHDGEIYRRQEGGGWEKHTDGGWTPTNLGQSQHTLDRERTARSTGESRWQGYRSGSFRSAGGGGRARPAMRGGGRRR